MLQGRAVLFDFFGTFYPCSYQKINFRDSSAQIYILRNSIS